MTATLTDSAGGTDIAEHIELFEKPTNTGEKRSRVVQIA